NWGYRTFKTTEELRAGYRQLMLRLHPLIAKGLSAAVYTQTTDVEVEVNGLMTYDREVIKFDVDETAAWHKVFSGPPPEDREVVPTSRAQGLPWRYTFDRPAEDWFKADFADDGWKEGPGGFGTAGTPGAVVRTEWKTDDIWIRRAFMLGRGALTNPLLLIHHDEDAEVYVNGVLAARVAGYGTDSEEVPPSAAGRPALGPGRTRVAAHCTRARGGQDSDGGRVDVVPRGRAAGR